MSVCWPVWCQIIYVCCERLLEIAGRQCTDETHKARLFISSSRFLSHDSTLARDSLFHSAEPLNEVATGPVNNRDQLAAPTNPLMSSIVMRASISFESLLPIRKSGMMGRTSPSSAAVSLTVGPRSSGSGLLPIVNHSLMNTTSKSDVDHLPAIAASRRSGRRSSVASTSMAVIDALGSVRADCSPESLVRVDEHKQNINKSATEWWQLRMENDPAVLVTLLWDWLDELRVSYDWQYVRPCKVFCDLWKCFLCPPARVFCVVCVCVCARACVYVSACKLIIGVP